VQYLLPFIMALIIRFVFSDMLEKCFFAVLKKLDPELEAKVQKMAPRTFMDTLKGEWVHTRSMPSYWSPCLGLRNLGRLLRVVKAIPALAVIGDDFQGPRVDLVWGWGWAAEGKRLLSLLTYLPILSLIQLLSFIPGLSFVIKFGYQVRDPPQHTPVYRHVATARVQQATALSISRRGESTSVRGHYPPVGVKWLTPHSSSRRPLARNRLSPVIALRGRQMYTLHKYFEPLWATVLAVLSVFSPTEFYTTLAIQAFLSQIFLFQEVMQTYLRRVKLSPRSAHQSRDYFKNRRLRLLDREGLWGARRGRWCGLIEESHA
jgi:hypothetical protein